MTAVARQPRRKGFAATRPPDISDARWQEALRGLQAFVAGGWGEKAEALGWPRDELYRAPPVWSRVDLCGAALLIGDDEVTEVTASEIRIQTASGASQTFYRAPEPDLALIYRERLKLFGEDSTKEEPQLRALEHTVRVCRDHTGLGLEGAKSKVTVAIVAAQKRGAANG